MQKSTGKAAVLTVDTKSFTVAKQYQWSLGWTLFVPFVYKDTQLYLAYKAEKGQGKSLYFFSLIIT